MKTSNSVSPSGAGRVASLHLHSEQRGEPFQPVSEFFVETDKGIVGNPRYYGRRNRRGQPSRRQVSLMEREQIAEHAATLGLEQIAPGLVRANIETINIDLIALVGKNISIGEAVLFLYEPRDPCSRMDDICMGLHDLMKPHKQGVLAQVIQSGQIRVGDEIREIKCGKIKDFL